MRRENVNDYLAFIAVARNKSFTKAAAQLGVSQSALSYTVRTLEARLGLRLLTRTTRSVSVTDAGERLLDRIAPHFDAIESEVVALSGMRDKPAGTVRIMRPKRFCGPSWSPCFATILTSTSRSSANTRCGTSLPIATMRACGSANRSTRT